MLTSSLTKTTMTCGETAPSSSSFSSQSSSSSFASSSARVQPSTTTSNNNQLLIPIKTKTTVNHTSHYNSFHHHLFILFFLLLFTISPSNGTTTVKTVFEHPLATHSFYLFTEISTPSLKLSSISTKENPRLFRLFFLPKKAHVNRNNSNNNNNDDHYYHNNNEDMYVVGVDFVYRLNPADVSRPPQSSSNLTSEASYQQYATQGVKYCAKTVIIQNDDQTPHYVCRNHVQSLYVVATPDTATTATPSLLVCSSGMGLPQLYQLNMDSLKVSKVFPSHKHFFTNYHTKDRSSGYGICPGLPYTISSTILTAPTPPSSPKTPSPSPPTFSIYSGGSIDMFYNSVLMRSDFDASTFKPLRALKAQEYPTIKDVHYVASVETADFVYVFSNERALSSDRWMGHEELFPTVTRLCKNDQHTKVDNQFDFNIKMKLLCEMEVDSRKLVFNVLKDLVFFKNRGQIHGLFTTSNEVGSAICIFERASIDSMVGRVEMVTSKKIYDVGVLTFSSLNLVPPLKLKGCSTPPSEDNYIGEEPVKHASRAHPVAFNDSRSFIKMAVEPVDLPDCKGVHHPSVDFGCFVYWLYDPTKAGYLQRFYNKNLFRVFEIVPINILRLFKQPNQISNLWDLQYKSLNGEGHIYAVTDLHVIQLDVFLCPYHARCTTCANDPHCMWDVEGRKCVKRRYRKKGEQGGEKVVYRSYLDDVLKLCKASCFDEKSTQVISGSSLQLMCHSRCHATTHPTWTLNDQPISAHPTEDDDVACAKKRNSYFNLFSLSITEYNADYYKRLSLSSSSFHNPYFQDTPPPDNTPPPPIVDPLTFSLTIPNASYPLHNGTYECRDALTGVVLARHHVTVTKFCKYGVNLESTWRHEYSRWCKLYEEQVGIHSCYKRCSAEKDCFNGCLSNN